MSRVLIISHDLVDVRMAGPGIRYWQFARALSQEFDVTLAVPGQTALAGEGFAMRPFQRGQPESLSDLIADADVVVAFSYLLADCPWLAEIEKPLVIDTYVPYPLEGLEMNRSLPPDDRLHMGDYGVAVLQTAFRAGDFFLCASEEQRDLWLGLLMAQGRLNPLTYDADPTLRSLIDVVPFGLPSEPPRHTKPVLKGIVSGIAPDDQVILWGGGIWEWLDPLTLIRAVAQIVLQRPQVKLIFPGTRHPNEQVPDMPIRQRAQALAQELGLLDRHVFFGEWVAYEDWPNYLLEADVGVSLHFATAETRFAFRTRLLDYIWAGLPIVATHGDALSKLIATHELGILVDVENVEQITAALLRLLDTPNLRQAYQVRFQRMAASLTWEAVTEPLTRFCRQPHLAPDKAVWGRITPEQRALQAERALRAQQAKHITGLEQHARNLEALIRARDEHIAGLEQHIRNLEQIRQAQSEHIANLEQHARNLETLIQGRDEHVANLEEIRREQSQAIACLEAERAAYQQTIFFKVFAQLHNWKGKSG